MLHVLDLICFGSDIDAADEEDDVMLKQMHADSSCGTGGGYSGA